LRTRPSRPSAGVRNRSSFTSLLGQATSACRLSK
jgi:hypothetical protein